MSEARILEVEQYVQIGAENFHSQSRDLSSHMRAAFRISQAPVLPNPGRAGQLDPNGMGWLWRVFEFIGIKWQLAAQATMTRPGFETFINLKTSQVPSYLTVYEMTTPLLIALVERYGLPSALDAFYEEQSSSSIPNWDVVRAWVTQEFLNLYVSQGAYKKYGWWLFPGDAGGPFSDPQHLPYRTASNG